MDTAEAVAAVMALMGAAKKAALATVSPPDGAPFASLVLVAFDKTGAPLFLMSGLAVHTKNLAADARASLLIDGTDAQGDPMAGGRVSLKGRIEKTTAADVRAAFLSQHPSAASYADFGDFAFYRMEVASAHLVQGFGRIIEIAGDNLRSA